MSKQDQAKQMASQLSKSPGLSELYSRLWFVVLALLVFRIGAHIPLPGINPEAWVEAYTEQSGTLFGLANMFSGGSVERMSIFVLGVMPYISASIIMQLLTAVSPHLEQLKKEGEQGRRKITQYTRYLTIVLGLFQALGVASGLASSQGVVMSDGAGFYLTAIITLLTGTVFLMWLGEQITERGIGNGISLLIFAGIVAGIPSAIGQASTQALQGDISWFILILVALIAISVVYFVVFVERGQRKIQVNYAKRQQGRKVFAAQQSHLPLKVNMAGVIPAIFASTLLIFPASIAQWFGSGDEDSWLQVVVNALSVGQPLYALCFALGIIFFCYVYTAITFNPREVADNLKKGGAYIPGIRPGEQTSRYIDGIIGRLTLVGALYMTAVCLLPIFLNSEFNIPFYLGGTSLLIVVVVVMDFMSKIQELLVSSQYEKFMNKANMKGQGGTGLVR